MFRLAYLALLFFVIFMWGGNSQFLENANLMMKIGMHGMFVCMSLLCLRGIVKNG